MGPTPKPTKSRSKSIHRAPCSAFSFLVAYACSFHISMQSKISIFRGEISGSSWGKLSPLVFRQHGDDRSLIFMTRTSIEEIT